MPEVGSTKLRILELATKPSSYSELERGSGVSRSIFNKHLNDLLREGLIEKTEEGLYVVTPKGLEVLITHMESRGRTTLHRLWETLTPAKEEYPEEATNVLLEFGFKLVNLAFRAASLSALLNLLSVNPVPQDRYVETLNLADTCSSIVYDTHLLTLYFLEKLKRVPKKYRQVFTKHLSSIVSAGEKLGEEYGEKRWVLPYETIKEMIRDNLERIRKAVEELWETASKLGGIAEMLEDKALMLSAIYIRSKLEELGRKTEEALKMLSV